METTRTVLALRARIREWRAAGERVALVPTMGALHSGHISLIHAARRRSQRVIASVFVNPMQFGPGEDLSRYPRQEAKDAEMLRQAGCDMLFLPTVDAIYPSGFSTKVSVSGLDEPLEGASRPGHFDGVATVVTKLLLMAFPDVAVFGEKDWQQLAVIRRLVADLDIPVEIIGAPILRETDGLALSSRNAYLTAGQRAVAAALPRTMRAAIATLSEGAAVGETLSTAKVSLESAGFKVDYLTLADGLSLQALDELRPGARLFAAAKLGTTRLIDNMPAASE